MFEKSESDTIFCISELSKKLIVIKEIEKVIFFII